MNSDQIERILTQDPYTKQVFKDVCPRDRLPASISYPSAFVLNTDPSWRKGEHWIAVYFDENKRGEFMDSYALNPEFYNFDSFMNENATTWSCNSKSIQNPLSVVCGHYCVYYILYRCRDVSMKKILSPFTSNVVKNDQMIEKFIQYNFNVKIDYGIDQFLS